MTAATFQRDHTVVGTLRDGKKVVFSHIIPDDGDGAGVCRIDPLKQIYAYHWGVTQNVLSGTATSYTVEPGGTVSMPTTTSANLLVITPAAACSSGDTTIVIMSIGV